MNQPNKSENKKVITTQVVQQAKREGLTEILHPQKNCIITDEARTLAAKLNIKLTPVKSAEAAQPSGNHPAPAIDEKLARQVLELVMQKLPPEQRRNERVKEIVSEVLAEYLKR
jgi:hypothetical protein